MSPQDREAAPREVEIRARLNAATPGPWQPPSCFPGDVRDLTRVIWTGDGEQMVAQTLSRHDVPEDEGFTQEQALRNGDFIAHAPDDITFLLGETARLRARLATLANAASRLMESVGIDEGEEMLPVWQNLLDATKSARDA